MKKINSISILMFSVLLITLSIVIVSCSSRSGQRRVMANAKPDTTLLVRSVPMRYQIMREDGQVLWVGNPETVDAVEGDTIIVRQYTTVFMEDERKVVYGFFKGQVPAGYADSVGYEAFYKAIIIK